MLQVVDFRTAADTGRANSDSIAPVLNGESADQIPFRRPTENVRARTQTLRDRVRDNMLRHDYGKYLLFGGGVITPAGGGGGELVFTLGEDLYVLPPATAGTDVSAPYVASTKSSLSVGTPSSNEIVFTSVQKAYEGFTAAADVNNISMEIVDGGTGASLAVTVVDRHILVTIDQGVHTCTDVISTVNGDASANVLVLASLGSGSTGTNYCDVFDATTWTNYTDRFLRGGVPGLAHKITPAGLVSFFSTTANELQVGDTLAVAYDQLVSATTTGGRLQSTPENANITVDSALFNTRRYPAYVPDCIPICKRVAADVLMFVTGDVFYSTRPALLGYDSLVQAAIDADAENASLATPLNWDRIGDGPTHNPPVTIRQALDNTDGRLDLTMNETEAARTSALTGAQAALATRLAADMDHIGRTVVTVSDGTQSTGGLYNGITALQDAITALGGGRTYLVRKGTYNISANNVFTDRVRIIAQDSGTVNLIFTVGSGYGFTFNTGSDGSVIDGVSCSTGGITDFINIADGVRHVCIRNGNYEGSITSSGKHTVIEGIDFYIDGAFDTIILGGTAHTTIQDCTFFSLEPTTATIVMDAGGTGDDKQLIIRHCEFTLGNGNYRVLYTGANSHQTVIDDVKITCSPFTDATRAIVELNGYQQRITNLRFNVASTSTVRQSLFRMTGNGTVEDVEIDFNSSILNYAASKQPVRIESSQGPTRVQNLRVQDWLWAGDGTPMMQYPLVTVMSTSVRSSIIVDNFSAADMGGSGTPTIAWIGAILGSEKTGLTATGAGEWVIRNANIDTTGMPYHGLLDSLYVITNVPMNAVIENNEIVGTGDPHFIVAENVQGVTIRGNIIYASGSNIGFVIMVKGQTSYECDFANVESNLIYHGTSRWTTSAVPLYVTCTTSTCQRPKVTNNTVVYNGGGTAPGNSIEIDNSVKLTCFHNNVSDGIAYTGTATSPLPISGSLATYNQLA